LSNIFSITISLHAALAVFRDRLPIRYVIGYIGSAFIGIGSFAFHATLLYQAQLADEIPMILLASSLLFLVFDSQPGFALRLHSLFIIAGLLAFDVSFSWSYYVYRNPVYHQVVFGVMAVAITARIIYLLHWTNLCAHMSSKARSSTSGLLWSGSTLFVLGFAIWNIDNICCDPLNRWKVVVGWPTAFFLEGHAWWHIFTALGGYLMITGMTYLTLCIKDDPNKYTIAYTCRLPRVARLRVRKPSQ